MFRPSGVQTFTIIRLNNPVYGQHSIMEIYTIILKMSTVSILHFTLSLHVIPGLQSVFNSKFDLSQYWSAAFQGVHALWGDSCGVLRGFHVLLASCVSTCMCSFPWVPFVLLACVRSLASLPDGDAHGVGVQSRYKICNAKKHGGV